MSDLFPPEFIAAISSLRLRAGSVPRGGRHGEHGSAQLGSGMEFRDYRSYQAGDDLRRIDWNLYQRSGSLFLRLFEEERNLPVNILLDCSDSMFFEKSPRANAAKQAAAIIIGAAINQQDNPKLYSFGKSLEVQFPTIQGRRAMPAVLDRLNKIGPSGATDLHSVLKKFQSFRQRPGILVIISDFFDEDAINTLEKSMNGLRHKLLLVRVARSSDAIPDLDGELLVEDCETGSGKHLTVTPKAIANYKKAFADFEKKLLDFANKRHAGYVTLDADQDVLKQFITIFNDGVITTHG